MVLGRQPSKDMLSVDALRSKVDPFFHFSHLLHSNRFIVGSGNGPYFGSVSTEMVEGWVPKSGTFFVCFRKRRRLSGSGFVSSLHKSLRIGRL